jgi:uncharacterized membrane protein YsdA (DUF1294 family)
MRTLQIYIIVINIAAFIIMGIDKNKAQRNKRRISEKSIFTTAFIGGALGVYLGMRFFHHKTKHLEFTVGIPAAVIINMVIFGYLMQRFK